MTKVTGVPVVRRNRYRRKAVAKIKLVETIKTPGEIFVVAENLYGDQQFSPNSVVAPLPRFE